MIELVDKISARFVTELARLGWPPLADFPDGSPGRILIGKPSDAGQHVPPRVLMRPVKSPFGPKDTTLGAFPNRPEAGSKYTAEGRAAVANLAFLTEQLQFEVRCWGICPVGAGTDPRAGELDYDFTRGLYTTLLATLQSINANDFSVGPGTWPQIAHTQRVGQELVFNLTMNIPVLRLGVSPPTVSGWKPGQAMPNSPKAPPVPAGGVQDQGKPFAPHGTTPFIEDEMRTPDGQTEPGCEE